MENENKDEKVLEIKIDHSLIQKGIAEATNKGIEEACSSYKIQSAIGDAVNDSILFEVIKKGVNDAVNALDLKEITAAIAKEMSKTVIASTTIMLKEASINTIARLRGIGDYSDKDKAERAKIREQFIPCLKKEKERIND